MREILFRGKRWDNGEWVCGDLLQYQNYTIIHSYQRGCRVADKVDPRTVGQYTGLTDKNGKKIFEGDILSCPSGVYPTVTVIFNEFCAAFQTEEESYFTDFFLCSINHAYMEVIGNIHDNSELLEQEVDDG